MSLLTRLILLLVLALTPAAVIQVINQADLAHEREMDVHQEAGRLLALIEAEQSRLVDGVHQTLLTVRQTDFTRTRDAAACQDFMDRLRPDFPDYLTLYIADQTGTIRCATESGAVGLAITERAHFQDALRTGGFVIGEYVESRTSGKAALPFALPIHDTAGVTAGVATALLDVGWLEAYLAAKPLPPDAAMTVADRHGRVLVRVPQLPGVVGQRLPERYLALTRAGTRGTAELVTLDGTARVVAYSPLQADPKGLFINVGLNKTHALTPIHQATRRSLVMLTAGFLIVLIMAVVGGNLMLRRPVSRLVRATQRWRDGDYSARGGVRGRSEVAVLGRAFDAMAEDLELHIQAHATSEARYQAVVDTAADAIVTIDEGSIIQSLNPAAVAMFGYVPAEAVGRNVGMLMPALDRARHDGYVGRYLNTDHPRIIGVGREVEGQRKDGSIFQLEVSIAEWRVDGQRFFTGVMRDISQRRRAEKALRLAKQEADRANLAKSRFLAAASHDLRQPVQSLLLFLGVLKQRLGATPLAGMTDAMDQALDGLRTLLDGLLDISKLDAGLVVAKPEAMPIAPLLNRLCGEYGPRARQQGLSFRIVLCDVVVRSDPVLLERMLRNLMENALRYTERGGVLVGCRRRGNQLRIAVVDTGIGIDPKRHEEVFEEFIQIGNPERDRAKGLGLGLAVVRRLGHLLGHAVHLRSSPGRGSNFSIDVPLASPDQVRPTGQAETPLTGGAGRVLMVDDEALVRLGLEAMVAGWGYQVTAVGDGAQAFACLDRFRPDVILADYRLRGGETGVAVIKAIRARLGANIPAAIITGDTAPERLVEAHAAGYALLHKPIAAAELNRALAALMTRTRHTGIDASAVEHDAESAVPSQPAGER